MTSDKRNKLIAAGRLPSEPVSVVADGELLTLEVRGLSAGARGDLLAACTREVPGDGDAMKSEIDQKLLYVQLILQCTYDPESGQRIFNDTDVDVVNGMAAHFCDALFKPAQRVSGLDADAVSTAAKNSDATPS